MERNGKVVILPEEPPVDDKAFRRMKAEESKRLGLWSELIVAADCVSRGYAVSWPAGQYKYDLVVDRGVDIVRVQIKTGSKGATMQARTGWVAHSYEFQHKAYRQIPITHYVDSDFDYLAAVDRTTGEVYYVPMSDVDLTKDSFTFSKENREKYVTF